MPEFLFDVSVFWKFLEINFGFQGNMRPQHDNDILQGSRITKYRLLTPMSVPRLDKEQVCLACYELFSPSVSITSPELTLIKMNL